MLKLKRVRGLTVLPHNRVKKGQKREKNVKRRRRRQRRHFPFEHIPSAPHPSEPLSLVMTLRLNRKVV